MKFAVLTGGGDVPGLNPAIKAIVNRVVHDGHEIVGIRRGWGGLVETNPSDAASVAKNFMALDQATVRTVDRSGGTFLHTSRTKPSTVADAHVPEFLQNQIGGGGPHDLTDHVVAVLDSQRIDVLLPIGGDDTLSYGLRIHQEGLPVVAIPKTMDNDVNGTDYCIGFSTAISRAVALVNNMRTSVGSHERLGVVELFGRYSGETALITAYLASMNRALIPEVPFEIEKLAKLLMISRERSPSNYAMVAISEGATPEGGEMALRGEADAYGHRKLGGIGQLLGDRLKEITGVNIMYQPLGYLMRSGPPDSLDLMVANNFGNMAADMAMAGSTGNMVAIRNGTYTAVPMEVTGQGTKSVDVDELYDVDEYRPYPRNLDGKPMFLY